MAFFASHVEFDTVLSHNGCGSLQRGTYLVEARPIAISVWSAAVPNSPEHPGIIHGAKVYRNLS